MGAGSVPGVWNQEDDNIDVDDGTMCRIPTPPPVPVCGYTNSCRNQPSQGEGNGAGGKAVNMILKAVDQIPELTGAAVALKFPVGETLLLREPVHASGLTTIVLADVKLGDPSEQVTWWQKWNGVVLNCGGAAISWGGVVVGGAAELPSLGASTPLTVVSYIGATATTAQCGLAVGKIASPEFRQYIDRHGRAFDTLDVALDVISLAGGVAGAVSAARSGGTLLKTSRYAEELDKLPKGQLVKTLEKIEAAEKDLNYFRDAVKKAIEKGLIADPASREFSNNLLRRALPIMTRSLRKEVLSSLANVFGQALSTWSSYYGGVGPKSLGIVNIVISILQESILSE